MAWKIILLFFIIIAGVVGIIYFYYEKPIQEEVLEYQTIRIAGLELDKFKKTGYKILLEGVFFKEGITDDRAYVHEQIPVNRSVKIFNQNIDNQSYSFYIINFISINTTTPKRIDFILNSPQEMNITENGIFGVDKNMSLLLETNTFIENIRFCIKGSSNIIYIQSSESFGTLKPENGHSKCFDTHSNLSKSSSLTLPINYRTFGILEEDDYINILIFNKIVHPETNEEFIQISQNYEIKK